MYRTSTCHPDVNTMYSYITIKKNQMNLHFMSHAMKICSEFNVEHSIRYVQNKFKLVKFEGKYFVFMGQFLSNR